MRPLPVIRILAGATAAVLLVPVAAVAETGTQEVTGTVDSSISMDTTGLTGTVNFETLAVGDNEAAGGFVEIASNETWTLAVRGNDDRLFDDSGVDLRKLAEPLRVEASDPGTLGLLGVGNEVAVTTTDQAIAEADQTVIDDLLDLLGGGGEAARVDLDLRQERVTTDPQGAYDMTLTYTASERV